MKDLSGPHRLRNAYTVAGKHHLAGSVMHLAHEDALRARHQGTAEPCEAPEQEPELYAAPEEAETEKAAPAPSSVAASEPEPVAVEASESADEGDESPARARRRRRREAADAGPEGAEPKSES